VHPQLLHFGSFFLPTYGFLVALGVLIGLWISVRNAERLGIDGDKAWNLGILVVLCGIVGAKVLYVINDWGYYSANPREIFSVSTLQAGGVFSGGLVAAFVAAAWYVRKHHLSPLGTCDAFAPGLALGHAIGRLGCFAAGCCYGKETHHWWAVTFTNPMAAAITGTPLGKPLEPTQLFECAVELANFFFLTWLLRRRKFNGEIIGAFMIIYGTARFFLEFLRGDPGRGSVFGGIMTGTQLIAIGLVIGGGVIWWLRPGMKRLTAQTAHATR
jgi:phosphatidylglycerol---prolipoprotein diacylglyceryl transferase